MSREVWNDKERIALEYILCKWVAEDLENLWFKENP
jgi:hypothetical protein